MYYQHFNVIYNIISVASTFALSFCYQFAVFVWHIPNVIICIRQNQSLKQKHNKTRIKYNTPQGEGVNSSVSKEYIFDHTVEQLHRNYLHKIIVGCR